MIVKNALGIPVYIPEWDSKIPAGDEGQSFEIPENKVHSTPSLKGAVAKGYIEVVSFNPNDGIEKSLAKISDRARSPESTFILDDVVVRGQMLDYSGYAKVNRNLIAALRSAGISTSADPVDLSKPSLLAEDGKSYPPLRPRACGVVDINSVVPTYGHPGSGNLKVLYTTVESETLPEHVVKSAKRYDRLWCVSNFCANTFKKYDVQADVLYPHIDMDIYKNNGAVHSFSDPLPSFKFLTVFGMSARKVGTNIIESFVRFFDRDDDACLIVAHRDKRGPDAVDEFSKSISDVVKKVGKSKPPLVVRMSKPLSENGLASLYRSVDACVLAARGEGFCLPYAEAALCGKPSVAPRFGGHLDFLTDSSAFLVDVEKRVMPKGTLNTILWDETIMADVTSEKFIHDYGKAMYACRASSEKSRTLMASRASDKISSICSKMSVVQQFKELVSK